MNKKNKKKIALIGGRGYTGSALLSLIAQHPQLQLAFASSRSQTGQTIQSACQTWAGDEQFIHLLPEHITDDEYQADVWVLAVPNGATQPWVSAITRAQPDAIIIDLSADNRFDDEKIWIYGLPEHQRAHIQTSTRIANPGCYATGAQLAIRPLLPYLQSSPHVFGISGYSGAGSTPSSKNDPVRLKDNIMAYHLSDHLHEREISHQLRHEVRFTPHVANFFSGIHLSISLTLHDQETFTPQTLFELFTEYYRNERFIQVTQDIPEVQNIQNTPYAQLGGFDVHPTHPNRVVVIATLDNLLKGAASQAMQNINLCLGFDEALGIV